MTMIYAEACVQVYMRGGELLGNAGVQHSEALVTQVERGVATKASWEKIMHTKTSNSVINATEHSPGHR